MSGVLKGKAFNPDGSLRDFNYGTVIGANSSAAKDLERRPLAPPGDTDPPPPQRFFRLQ